MGWIGVPLPPLNVMNITKGNDRRSERGGRKRVSVRSCARGQGRWTNVVIVVEVQEVMAVVVARMITLEVITMRVMPAVTTTTMPIIGTTEISITIRTIEETMIWNLEDTVTMEKAKVVGMIADIVAASKMIETADILVAIMMIETADIVAITMITPTHKMNIPTLTIMTTEELELTIVIIAVHPTPLHVAVDRMGGHRAEIDDHHMGPYE